MNILGIWDGHDAGAALLQDGVLRVAVNEERLSRRKLEIGFPARSIAACLAMAGLEPGDVHAVAASTSDPAKTLGRLWPGSRERFYRVRRRLVEPGPTARWTQSTKERIAAWPPNSLSTVLSRRLLGRTLITAGLARARLHLLDHHQAHAAAAAWGSGFESCGVLTIDGLGDGVSTTISLFDRGRLTTLARTSALNSLGVFFEHVTHLMNMRELEDEGKVMALADYAAPVPDERNPLLDMVRVRDGGLEFKYTGSALRRALARIHWRHPNEQFAYMAQRVVERVCEELAREALRLSKCRQLAIAGGVASNVKATRRVRLLPEVNDIYVFPHMGDGGLAVGAAALAAATSGATVDLCQGRMDLGQRFDTAAMTAALAQAGMSWNEPGDLSGAVADHLARGRVVMWFQGGMEFGPRALGHRSVLARPDRTDVRDRLNLALKRRVWYQPFCPSMLASEARRVLSDCTSLRNRAMTMAFEVAEPCRPMMSGVISVDGTCRPQFVADDDTSAFAELLRRARPLWGVGAVLNTSFNIHGEPLVCTPSDAVDVFRRSGADALAIGPYFVARSDV